MNDLLEFLTSEEIIIVYIIAALACFICIVVYIIEKNNDRLRKKHNTKELNKLVEEIRAIVPEEQLAMYDTPIETVMETPVESMTLAAPMVIGPIDVVENEMPIVEEAPIIEENKVIEEPKYIEASPIVEEEPTPVREISKEVEEEFEYTSIEPDEATARLELQKLKEQLEKESITPEPVDVINHYEEEQERQAIISLDELLSKSKEMYEANEITQYADEGNEPISIQDLELQVNKQAATYSEPFVIANVVPENELQEGINEAFEQAEVEVMHMDDMNTIKEEKVNPIKKEVKKFVASPIISPIFGIERDAARDNALALENTANFEKLDAEIRKKNEFYISMSELEGKE